MNAHPETPRPQDAGFCLASGYARLPARFFARQGAVPVAKPRLVKINRALAAELGIDVDALSEDVLAQLLCGNRAPPGADPIAMAYAGHQFGQFVPQLGDGRAILLGDAVDLHGVRRELQLKGSGRTPFSRGGDGRAALGPVLREYIVSEAMHALGIPTTRALAVVATGERVLRDRPLPGAVLTRVARSHVRIGTFEFFAARGDLDAVRVLADYVMVRDGADLVDAERPYLALLERAVVRQAGLIARWMGVGFIHGVMNTDNMSLSGETIDYGPCAFIDAYDPGKVFSSIDAHGRYAYSNQPHAAHWNLARLAETLAPLIDPDPERAAALANEVLAGFPRRFEDQWLGIMRSKLGLGTAEAADRELVDTWLDAMHRNEVDFTLGFRRLADAAESADGDAGVRALFADPNAYGDWACAWRARLAREPAAGEACAAAMRRVSPLFVARNHRVEQAIAAAVEREDFTAFESLLTVLSRPYEADERFAEYADPPAPGEQVLRTFCGT